MAELKNPELESEAAQLASQLGAAESALRIAEQRTAQDEIARASEERQKLAMELSVTRARLAGLTLRAPVSGRVVTSEFEARPGDFIGEGDEFVRIVDRTRMRARILVHDWELNDVAVGAQVSLKAAAEPYRTYAGTVERILPAAASDLPVSQPNKLERHGQELTNYFAVEMVFPNADGRLIEGMTGTAKISGKHRPYAWQVAAAGWRWVRSQIW